MNDRKSAEHNASPSSPLSPSRRDVVIGAASLATGAVLAAPSAGHGATAATTGTKPLTREETSSIRQSVCRWCYGRTPIDELAKAAVDIGLESIEILGPDDFPILQKNDLICAMVNSHGISKGINRPENHESCLQAIRDAIDAAADAGYPNVITFSGNRDGMSDAEGLDHCQKALEQIVPYAEKKKVTICMELLNSKIDHADYMADRTPWGVELVERLDSERFKLLYDIYHMQIMEGDVIRTIRDNHQYIGHYHTAGVPGRNEIDETQELYYPAIIRAIVDTGYEGVLGQEFIPKSDDPLESLREGVEICNV